LHVRLKQRIALKVLFPRLAAAPGPAERFLREAARSRKLNHPHLVHAVDAGQDGEYYYLAMGIHRGGKNLLQILQREGPLKPLRALEIVQAGAKRWGAGGKRARASRCEAREHPDWTRGVQ